MRLKNNKTLKKEYQPSALALASGPGPKLQAASDKLQASSRKLDKGAVPCYSIL